MSKKNQSEYVKRQKAKGFIYLQRWLPAELHEKIMKLISEYKE